MVGGGQCLAVGDSGKGIAPLASDDPCSPASGGCVLISSVCQSPEAFREVHAPVSKLLIRALGVVLICGGLVGLALGLALTVECQNACGESSKPPVIFALVGLAITSIGLRLFLHRETDTRTSSE